MRFKIVPIFLILSLAVVGTLGFLWLVSVDYNGHHFCPISAMLGTDCPPIGHILALADHHISGLQQFTLSIVSINSNFFVLFGLFSLSLLLIFVGSFLSILPNHFLCRHGPIKEPTINPQKQFLRWLALHNKRDPHSPPWVQGT